MNHPILLLALATLIPAQTPDPPRTPQTRPVDDPELLREWLVNMVAHHRYTDEEAAEVLGLTPAEIARKRTEWNIRPGDRPERGPGGTLRVLPYPGGRHPRVGFLDGAVDPRRDPKISVFTPWDPDAYVVVDVPEAVFCNLGLVYLAHTHVDTLWTLQNIQLPQREWTRNPDGSLSARHELPNEIVIEAEVRPAPEPRSRNAVLMTLRLRNGTPETLTAARVQNCVMLKGAPGFNQQTDRNKLLQPPYAAVHNPEKTRWIVTAWEPLQRAWANPPVPCIHADPQFSDTPPGKTSTIRGALWFLETEDIQSALRTLDQDREQWFQTNP